MKIDYRDKTVERWLRNLARVSPEALFEEIAEIVNSYQGTDLPLQEVAIRIEPNIRFWRGKPLYSKPCEDKRGWGYCSAYLIPPRIVLSVGTEFVVTAVHEFLHLICRYEYSALDPEGRNWVENRNVRENLIECTAQMIVLHWALNVREDSLPFYPEKLLAE